MSTKAIREGFAAMRSCIKSGEPWTSTMEEVHGKALAELEAIQKAAKDLVDLWGYAGDGNPYETLIRAIAKENE